MNGGTQDDPVFPGSRGATHVVEWIDGLLLELRDGRLNDARAALESEGWRALNLDGIPPPIANQLHDALADAAEAMRRESVGEVEEALLVARSRFLPGA